MVPVVIATDHEGSSLEGVLNRLALLIKYCTAQKVPSVREGC